MAFGAIFDGVGSYFLCFWDLFLMDFGTMCVCGVGMFSAFVYVIFVVFSMRLEYFSSRWLGLYDLGNELS